MKKIVIILSVLWCLVLPSAAVALTENDEPSAWAIPYIERSAELGLIPDSLYWRYPQPITRAEFCAIATRTFESVVGSEITESAYFYDTGDPNVAKMAGLGIVHGTEQNIFEPDREIKREEAAVLLSNLMRALNRPLQDSRPAFADLSSIAEWSRNEVGQVQAQGIMAGVGNNMFDPQGNLTIEQSIKTMLVIYDLAKAPEPEKISLNAPEMAGKKIPILMYHAIADVPTTSLTDLFVRPSELEAQLKYIAENGYQTITFEDLDNIGAFSKPLMLTFDDGYKDNYLILFPLLKKYNLKATIFVVTNSLWSDGRVSVDDIIEMSASGLVSIQSHTKNHLSLVNLDKESLINELSSSKQYLEELTQKPVVALCYPGGFVNASVRAEAAEYYSYAVLNYGGVFVCGGNTMSMNRIRISRGMGMAGFAALIK